MFTNTFARRILFNFAVIFVFLSIYILIFHPIYQADSIMVNFVNTPFDIIKKYPEFWKNLKLYYIIISLFSSLIITNIIYSSLFTRSFKKNKSKKVNLNDLSLFISNDNTGNPIILPEASLYQNILITGTIGSGKTSSAMYPFTKQLIKYKHLDKSSKLGMLILDVKGNYYSQVQKYASLFQREDDLVVIELRWKY